MAIRVKDGVDFSVLRPAGFCILSALKQTSDRLGVNLTITSGCDGVHSGPLDPHKTGEAFDVRSHDLSPELRPKVVDAMLTILGREHFYGFIEDTGTSNEHFHFQRRRSTVFTVEDFLKA